jgi:anaerobic carbon-monoxide dehydrogenase iron sulfur subunit
MTRQLLRVVVDRCSGCGNCEMACAFVHAGGGVPGRPRVSVVRDVPPRPGRGTPIVCLQCDDAACVAACPVGALVRNEATGAIDLLEPQCVRCGSCVGACPFGNALWDLGRHLVVKCDLCGGDPWCARFCPTGALAFVRPEADDAAGDRLRMAPAAR